jgi:chromosome segregation ATPase
MIQDEKSDHLQIKDLEIFEKEISKVLHEMMNSNGLENLRVQYEGLFRALKASHEREQQYSLKCKELKDAIMFDKLGIENVMKQTQEDDLAKKKLKEELKSMESKIETMKNKDEMNRKKIEGLKKSVNKMNDTIKTWETLKNGIDNQFFEIINDVDTLNCK